MAKIDLKAVLGNKKLINNPYVDDVVENVVVKNETLENTTTNNNVVTTAVNNIVENTNPIGTTKLNSLETTNDKITNATKKAPLKLALKQKEVKKSVTWYMKENNSSKIHELAKQHSTTAGDVLDYIIEDFFSNNS